MLFICCFDAGCYTADMQVTVLGANGKVGQLVVQYLLDDGYNVVAFVHSSNSLPYHARLKIRQGDVHESDDIAAAVAGSKAVVSCLSSWHAPDKDVLSAAMQRLVPAMRQAGITRVVSLTGAGAFDLGDTPSLFYRAQHIMMNATTPKVLRDAEDHIQLLRESRLHWTVLRSPVMNESGSRDYALQANPPAPWKTVHRHAVARCLADMVESMEYDRQAPFIVRH